MTNWPPVEEEANEGFLGRFLPDSEPCSRPSWPLPGRNRGLLGNFRAAWYVYQGVWSVARRWSHVLSTMRENIRGKGQLLLPLRCGLVDAFTAQEAHPFQTE